MRERRSTSRFLFSTATFDRPLNNALAVTAQKEGRKEESMNPPGWHPLSSPFHGRGSFGQIEVGPRRSLRPQLLPNYETEGQGRWLSQCFNFSYSEYGSVLVNIKHSSTSMVQYSFLCKREIFSLGSIWVLTFGGLPSSAASPASAKSMERSAAWKDLFR